MTVLTDGQDELVHPRLNEAAATFGENWQARGAQHELTSRESVRENADVRHNRSTPEEVVIPQHLRHLAQLRRVRDRTDREYAQPPDVEVLDRDANMSAGHLSREFGLAYGESPYSYPMTRRIERATALLRRARRNR